MSTPDFTMSFYKNETTGEITQREVSFTFTPEPVLTPANKDWIKHWLDLNKEPKQKLEFVITKTNAKYRRLSKRKQKKYEHKLKRILLKDVQPTSVELSSNADGLTFDTIFEFERIK